jgi:hypothetical protein
MLPVLDFLPTLASVSPTGWLVSLGMTPGGARAVLIGAGCVMALRALASFVAASGVSISRSVAVLIGALRRGDGPGR